MLSVEPQESVEDDGMWTVHLKDYLGKRTMETSRRR